MDALAEFKKIITRNRDGQQAGIVSVCSAHSTVIAAALRSAQEYNTTALIESTSNQVDQNGGYTGMTPKEFVAKVYAIADQEKVDRNCILFGGDHLGPNAWQHLSGNEAMDNSCDLVASYIEAGYKKIHLDASFICADDSTPLDESIIARRCAQMAKVCEEKKSGADPVYVIGTEVPTPGGDTGEDTLELTTPEDVKRAMMIFKKAFVDAGLADTWDRVVGLVVQPGVEFSNDSIHHYNLAGNPLLASTIHDFDRLVYEAHSTDYQTRGQLTAMVKDHFGILKVGPWLTFALRESLFLLEAIEKELSFIKPSSFRQTLIDCMKNDPEYWQKHHPTSDDLMYNLAFSYFDRARYYLNYEPVTAAIRQLYSNLQTEIPKPLLSQYLPNQYKKVCAGTLHNTPYDLSVDRVCEVIDVYMSACGMTKEM